MEAQAVVERDHVGHLVAGAGGHPVRLFVALDDVAQVDIQGDAQLDEALEIGVGELGELVGPVDHAGAHRVAVRGGVPAHVPEVLGADQIHRVGDGERSAGPLPYSPTRGHPHRSPPRPRPPPSRSTFVRASRSLRDHRTVCEQFPHKPETSTARDEVFAGSSSLAALEGSRAASVR